MKTRSATRAATRRIAAALAVTAALAAPGAALAQGDQPPAAQTAQPPKTPSAPAAQASPPASAPAPAAKHERVSKFEARRIRQACRDQAKDRAVKGVEREAFLSKCYFGRVSHRGLRRECAQQATAKGVTDKSAIRDFVRACVKERTKQ